MALTSIDPPLTGSQPTTSSSFMRFVHNAEMDKIAEDNRKEIEEQSQPKIRALTALVLHTFERNSRHRRDSGVEDQMIFNMQARNNEYGSDKISEILSAGGTDVFIGITGTKCRAAEAMIKDVLMSDRERSWRIEPSPVPELPPEVEDAILGRVERRNFEVFQETGQQLTEDDARQMVSVLMKAMEEQINEEATQRADRMQEKIDDQLLDGGFSPAMDEFLHFLTTSKAAVMKGPVLMNRKALEYNKPLLGGITTTRVTDKLVHVWRTVNPLDCYPSDGAQSTQDGHFIERMRLTRRSLSALRGVENYDNEAINLVLTTHEVDGFRHFEPVDSFRASLEERSSDRSANLDWIEALEFWGSIDGATLIGEGYTKTPSGETIIPLDQYEMNLITIGNVLIYSAFNPDPLGRRPYSHTGWAVIPGSFWFKGIPELMEDLQSICNASVRALVNNLAIASGPQVVINDITRLAKGEEIDSMEPWRVWQFVNQIQGGSPPIDFFQPNSNSKELLSVYEFFSRLSDEFLGIPAFSHGATGVGVAGRTFRGLSAILSSAAKGIKRVIGRVDVDVIEPCIRRQFDWNMLFIKDESIKGDVEIKADGAMAIIVREQAADSRMQFIQATSNELDQDIIGPEKRANILREAAAATQMKLSDVMPSRKEMRLRAERLEQERSLQKRAEVKLMNSQAVASLRP